jgi:dynein heavy chain, axonemal
MVADSGSGGKKKDELPETIKYFKDNLSANPLFKLGELKNKVKDNIGPYDIVAIQECERLNYIFGVLMKSLDELEKGLNGELSETDAMVELKKALLLNKLPATWDDAAGFPSKKTLKSWFVDLIKRYVQMQEWTKEMKLPKCVTISYLCNPMSFVTAVKQVTARIKGLALDNLDIMTEVTAFSTEDLVKEYPKTGVYVYGLFLQGSRWEEANGDGK